MHLSQALDAPAMQPSWCMPHAACDMLPPAASCYAVQATFHQRPAPTLTEQAVCCGALCQFAGHAAGVACRAGTAEVAAAACPATQGPQASVESSQAKCIRPAAVHRAVRQLRQGARAGTGAVGCWQVLGVCISKTTQQDTI